MKAHGLAAPADVVRLWQASAPPSCRARRSKRRSIARCTDPDELEAWLQQAATIAHTDDLFG